MSKAIKLATHADNKATSLFVHHTGKDTTKGLEGSHAFKSSADFFISLAKTDDYMSSITCEKQKDGEKFSKFEVQATIVGTGIFDEDGDEVTSLVIEKPLETAKLPIAVIAKPIEPMKGTAREQMLIAIKSLHEAQANNAGHDGVIVEARDIKEFLLLNGKAKDGTDASSKQKEKLFHRQNLDRLVKGCFIEKRGSGYVPTNGNHNNHKPVLIEYKV